MDVVYFNKTLLTTITSCPTTSGKGRITGRTLAFVVTCVGELDRNPNLGRKDIFDARWHGPRGQLWQPVAKGPMLLSILGPEIRRGGPF